MTGLNEQVERWVVISGKYAEQNLVDAAMDACYEVIRYNIDYLPIHLRIGEIFERMGQINDALVKYQTLIDAYMVSGAAKRAIDVYFRLLDLSPETVNARSKLADLLHQDNRNEEAAEQLSHVASHYLRIGQTNRALEEFRRALNWASKAREVRAQYGLALFKLGRYESALSEFYRAMDDDTTNPVAIARINMTLAVMGEQPSAIWDSLASVLEQSKSQPQVLNLVQAEYRTALTSADEPILHYIVGIIQQQGKQHSSSLLSFEQTQALLEEDPDPLLPMVLVHQAMADSYIALGQAEEALEQLHLAQQVASSTSAETSVRHPFARPLSQGEIVRRMAEAYAAQDDLEGAERALVEAVRLLPYDHTVYTKLADIYFSQGKLNEAVNALSDLASHYEDQQNLDRAIETLESAQKLSPGSIPVGERLARLYIRRGYPQKGVDGLIKVSDLQSRTGLIKDAVISLQQAAEIYWMQGNHEETRRIYDRIITIAPNDIEARQWLAIMYTLAGRVKDAIAEKKQIIRIYSQKQDFDNAIAELHQVIGLDQKDIEAYYLLGDMLMRREEYAQAMQLYSRMMKMEGVESDRIEALHTAASRMNEQKTQLQSTADRPK